jgi:hypothetical protein
MNDIVESVKKFEDIVKRNERFVQELQLVVFNMEITAAHLTGVDKEVMAPISAELQRIVSSIKDNTQQIEDHLEVIKSDYRRNTK